MAPPHATKTSITTNTQVACPGNRQPRKQITEEVQELENCGDTDATDIDDEADKEDPEEPQDTSERLDHMLAKIVNDQRTRHKVNKLAVGKSYNATSATLQDSVNTLFDEYEGKASLAHEAHLGRLKHLLTEKVRIEVAMADKLKELQAGYDAHSRDLEMVMNRRIKEMREY